MSRFFTDGIQGANALVYDGLGSLQLQAGTLNASSDTAPPLLLDGPAALSVFALAECKPKSLRWLRRICPRAAAAGRLSQYESRQVHQLLTYGLLNYPQSRVNG